MRTLFITLALVACSSDKKPAVDAAVQIDAAPDALPAVKLDCPTYCTEIQTNCTGTNAQYGGMNAADATAHCMATCAKFTPGTLADQSGNTLGCRIYHAGAPAMGAPTTHCIHGGPAGNQTDAAAGLCGDACTSFCTLEIGVCGAVGATNPNGQYADMNACLLACNGNPAANPPVPGFDKTHKYIVDGSVSPTMNPKGDSLACRLYHATNAAISATNATMHCPHTAAVAAINTPCNGAAMP